MNNAPGLNPNRNVITTSTIESWFSRNMAVAIAQRMAFLYLILRRQKGKGGSIEDHGYKINMPFRHPTAQQPRAVAVQDGNTDIPAPVPIGGLTAYQWEPMLLMGNMGIPKYDDRAQGKETTRIKYYEFAMAQTLDAHVERLHQELFSPASTAGSNGTKERLTSVLTMINGGNNGAANANAGQGLPPTRPRQALAPIGGASDLVIIGGVNRNQPNGAYSCPIIYNPTTADAPSVNLLRKGYNETMDGTRHNDIILVPRILYTYFDSVVESQQNREGNQSALAQIGYESIRYKKADIVCEDGIPSTDYLSATYNEILGLYTPALHLLYDSMEPKFTRKDIPRKPMKNWEFEQMIQFCTDNAGGVHWRHGKVSDPS